MSNINITTVSFARKMEKESFPVAQIRLDGSVNPYYDEFLMDLAILNSNDAKELAAGASDPKKGSEESRWNMLFGMAREVRRDWQTAEEEQNAFMAKIASEEKKNTIKSVEAERAKREKKQQKERAKEEEEQQKELTKLVQKADLRRENRRRRFGRTSTTGSTSTAPSDNESDNVVDDDYNDDDASDKLPPRDESDNDADAAAADAADAAEPPAKKTKRAESAAEPPESSKSDRRCTCMSQIKTTGDCRVCLN